MVKNCQEHLCIYCKDNNNDNKYYEHNIINLY